ncbi:MAG TPA: hypothetical protein VFZ53_23675 [Polyangiaceae bacterium]
MLLACAIAVVAVALGLGLGLAPVGRARLAGPLRTFALAAVLTVIFLHLLPEALSELGVIALGLFLATSVVPAWARLARGVFSPSHDAEGAVHGGLVAGYVGLLVHHVGDGLGLGAYAALPGGVASHADVMLALAAHTVPLVAVVAFAFQHAAGSGGALRAASGLAAASVLGVVLSSVVPEALVERSAAWIAALVAGLLAHVVTHDLDRDLPATPGARVVDALAAVAGVATSLLGGEHSAEHHHPDAFAIVGANVLGQLSFAVIAALVVALLVARVDRVPFRRPLAAAFGPSLGVDGFVVALLLGGVGWSALYVLFALVVALVVQAATPNGVELAAPEPSRKPPWFIHLDDGLTDALPWVAGAFVLATLLGSRLEGRPLESLSLPLAFALVVLVALPVRVPPLAAVLVAVTLERSGASFEVALVFAVLASAPGAVDLAAIARRAPSRAAARFAAAVVAVVVALGAAVALGRDFFAPLGPLFPEVRPRLAFLVLAALFLRAAFERGLRGLLLPIVPSHDTASHAEGAHGTAPASSEKPLPNAGGISGR